VILEKGRVVWQGSSQALRAAPQVLQQYVGV
jgi:branched-chain amino acid transport system ATP-binding protein